MKKKSRHKAQGNPVAKHMRAFNNAVTMRDRKKAAKRGAIKHKGRQYDQ